MYTVKSIEHVCFPKCRYKLCLTFSQKSVIQPVIKQWFLCKAIFLYIDLFYHLFSRHIFWHHPPKMVRTDYIPGIPRPYGERSETRSCKHCLYWTDWKQTTLAKDNKCHMRWSPQHKTVSNFREIQGD